MAFKPGKGKTGGRQKGVPNKLTRTVKESVLETYWLLQKDPKANLLIWGRTNPGLFYQIAAKLIPSEINAHMDHRVINVVPPGKKSKNQESE